jgi:predicted nucleotide-binding protein (sugar kinase/HSP70/actin superfamily)
VVAALRRAADQFGALPVDRRQRRPIIGLVGEIYIRLNAFGNGDIIRKIEGAGGEVMLASLMEWLYFTTGWGYREYLRPFWGYRDFVTSLLTDAYQRYEERRLARPVAHLLTFPEESPIATLLGHLRPYYSPALNSEAILSMGKAIDFAHHGLSGIVNIMPFSCMPGLITAGMAPRLRADLDGIPWLDIACDAQHATNIQTRLEAFLYQALQFQRRTANAAEAGRPAMTAGRP